MLIYEHIFFKKYWPILDDRMKEKFLKPRKGVLCIHLGKIPETLTGCPLFSLSCLSVQLCVCLAVSELPSTVFLPRNLIFCFEWPLGQGGKNSRHFHFYPLKKIVLHYTLVNIFFQATGQSFWPRYVIFGLRGPCTIRN